MLKKYYRLHLFLEDYSPKSWVSNIKVRWCRDDEAKQPFAYLFRIEKIGGAYEMWLFDRTIRATRRIGRYKTLEDAFFEARKIWLSMDASVVEQDVSIIKSTHLGHWVKTDRVNRFVENNKCKNVQTGSTYRGKVLLWWDNFEAVM